ncbi:hypothetical protein COO60DRAFT_638698 [Scenedesmus sp. NREL 46B-D3]|nr:hypothetical protein COO60DRAFT_638698 [Scenedesmus sp. NREL 46B-D3]
MASPTATATAISFLLLLSCCSNTCSVVALSTSTAAADASCPEYLPTGKYRTTSFTDVLNTTKKVSPKRPNANVPTGQWIPGRATFYGTDPRIESAHTACGEPAGSFGVLAYGSCGYTNGDGSLPYPADMYAAAADTNVDYAGSCGRCYQVRCRTGSPENNGRPLRISDLQYYKPYQIKDNQGRDWPGNPFETQDMFYTKCWDEQQVITVRVADSCPCNYFIKFTGETRLQPWCCGGNNHFDLSVFAFQKLAHPSYGVMKMEYRPVNCKTGQPLKPVPGFINTTIYDEVIGAGWTFQPYLAKNQNLLARTQGVDKSTGMCASLSKGGAISFVCKRCTQAGYQPFGKAKSLRFWIRSDTKSSNPFASSTPPGQLPPLKVFLMNHEKELYCGQEIQLSDLGPNKVKKQGPWHRVDIPLVDWRCKDGSAGNRANVNRVDFQNVRERDANICMDRIRLV